MGQTDALTEDGHRSHSGLVFGFILLFNAGDPYYLRYKNNNNTNKQICIAAYVVTSEEITTSSIRYNTGL